MKLSFALLIIFGILQCLAKPANNNEILTAFHPITEEQYDAILGLTSGEPIISEARLISSGIAAFKGIAAGLTLGLSTSWLPTIFNNIVGTQRNNTEEVLNIQDGYPLCVVRKPDDEHANDENNIPQRVSSVVKCIMVVQQDNKKKETNKDKEEVAVTETEDQSHKPYYTSYAEHNEPYPQPYPYTYPWYSRFYNYPAQYEPNTYEATPNEFNDFIPYYRFYSNYYDNPYAYHDENNFTPKKKTSNKKKLKRSKTRRRKPTTNKGSSTVKPRKTKRDQYSKNIPLAPNYTKMSTYSNQAYQPANYPQISYHSQYPKVAYSTTYNYPAPVYIGTTPKPTPRLNSNEQSEDYMEARYYNN